MLSSDDFERPDEVTIGEEYVDVEIPEDTERALNLYRTSPIFRAAIENEIRGHNQYVHEDRAIRQYQPAGFCYRYRGRTISIERELLMGPE